MQMLHSSNTLQTLRFHHPVQHLHLLLKERRRKRFYKTLKISLRLLHLLHLLFLQNDLVFELPSSTVNLLCQNAPMALASKSITLVSRSFIHLKALLSPYHCAFTCHQVIGDRLSLLSSLTRSNSILWLSTVEKTKRYTSGWSTRRPMFRLSHMDNI